MSRNADRDNVRYASHIGVPQPSPETRMNLEDVTLGLFAICNGIRVLAYVPQIVAAARDRNGATAIACTTWWLFLVANLSTIAYALVNQSDWRLAACFTANAACCIAILSVTYHKRRASVRQAQGSGPRRQAMLC
jgi:hypothetical protein